MRISFQKYILTVANVPHLVYIFSSFLVNTVGPELYHVELKIVSTWFNFCFHVEKFRTDLSSITEINFDRIKFVNVEKECKIPDLTTSFIDVDVYITELNNNSSLDTVATGNLVNILQNVKLIGKIKVRTFI